MSDKEDKEDYLFLGLPKSGKSTFFSLMAHYLQKTANESENLKFQFLETEYEDKETHEVFREDITSDFIDDCISRMKNQRWPRKTEDYEAGYSFKLIEYLTVFGKHDFLSSESVIDYHDYPGEAFEAAFGVAENPPEHILRAAQDMKERVGRTDGLFLIIDAEMLFMDFYADAKDVKSITSLFRLISRVNPSLKLAIIFNKLELFKDVNSDAEQINFVKIFREKCSNAFAHLPKNYRFFDNVYPLGNVAINEEGEAIPPRQINPKNILEPVKWMLGFDVIRCENNGNTQTKSGNTKCGCFLKILAWGLLSWGVYSAYSCVSQKYADPEPSSKHENQPAKEKPKEKTRKKTMPCQECGGDGTKWFMKCKKCSGSGEIK